MQQEKMRKLANIGCIEKIAEELHIEQQRMITLHVNVITMINENLVEPYPEKVITKFDKLIRGDFDNREIALMGYIMGSFLENAAVRSLERTMKEAEGK